MSVSTLSPPLPTPVAPYAGKADFFFKENRIFNLIKCLFKCVMNALKRMGNRGLKDVYKVSMLAPFINIYMIYKLF